MEWIWIALWTLLAVLGILVIVTLAIGFFYSQTLKDLENFDDADWDEDN